MLLQNSSLDPRSALAALSNQPHHGLSNPIKTTKKISFPRTTSLRAFFLASSWPLSLLNPASTTFDCLANMQFSSVKASYDKTQCHR